MFEAPLWDGFLNKLLAKTGSDAVKLLFQPSDEERIIELSAGNAVVLEERMLPEGGRRIGDAIAFRSMRPNRVYAQEELLDLAEAKRPDIPSLTGSSAPLKQLRAVRVTETGGLDLWLLCSGGKNIGSATSALLAALAPHLQIALRSHAALERERFRSSITGQAFDRLKMGWLSLDTGCHIIDATDNLDQLFQWGSVLRRGRYDRLVPASPSIDRALTSLVKSFAANSDARPQAFNLSKDPWVEMLVTPHQSQNFAGSRTPVAIVYISGDRRSQADRCDQLVDLFGLLPSEARLAWMLAQATSISEAADALGLTVETARNYSKKIYAKTGARGHAELVRIILTSVLAIS
ncbi:helix-turn-helix transcriptional regulator [Sphingorhabdus sp. IMCC26285]|uniref:Helix-turn-helix transcriptional regulator n=2 Tax=Sphingorhabdus profundilacus TaxID=2509718 RepID=A0A6I4LZ84_9SPHN|nr:helix-turn-helix transcriptional regulator [Sphingorhabdus profundilacus]